MHASSYYSRSPAATLLEQRGQTAVLGTGYAPAQSSVAPGAEDAAANLTGKAFPASLPAHLRPSRGVGRRKQRRSENARMTSNPHVVRPSPRDYSLRHNERHSSFPIPAELQQIYASSIAGGQGALDNETGDANTSQTTGPFSMSHSDAHWFLTHRCGVRPCGLEANSPSATQASRQDTNGLGAVQLFVKQAEAMMAAWIQQEVFLQPNMGSNAGREDTALVDLRHLQTGSGDSRDLRLFEVTRNPHNLVWSIPDPFMRLAVHCLARIVACPSFSKDTPHHLGESASPSSSLRQTWILKGRTHKLPRSRAVDSNDPAAPSDLETPPATDVGSELASDVALSDVASEADSAYAVSDMGEDAPIDEAIDETLGEGQWQTDIDTSRLSAGDTTLRSPPKAAAEAHGAIREDDEGWADVESDAG